MQHPDVRFPSLESYRCFSFCQFCQNFAMDIWSKSLLLDRVVCTLPIEWCVLSFCQMLIILAPVFVLLQMHTTFHQTKMRTARHCDLVTELPHMRRVGLTASGLWQIQKKF